MLLLSIPDFVVATNLSTEDLYVLDIRLAVGVPRSLNFGAVPLLRKTALWDALVPPVAAHTVSLDIVDGALTDGVYVTDRLPRPMTDTIATLPATITIVSTVAEDLYIGPYRIPALGSRTVDTTAKTSQRSSIWYDLARAIKRGYVTVAGLTDPMNRLIDGTESGHRYTDGHELTPADYAEYPAPIFDANEMDFSQDVNSMYVPLITWI